MSVIDGKILLTKNPCYRANKHMSPMGIVVHSTGANNPYIKRYIQPDDGIIGSNYYGNDWNNSHTEVCVHGFIGLDKNDEVKFYQCLPFDVCCWGVGGGWRGSYNYNPPFIQFEMCEDDLSDRVYCEKVYKKAVEVCVYLCQKYNLNPNNIVSHKEAYEQGYGSGHIDPTNWWDKFGYTMNAFRKEVKEQLADVKVMTKRDCRLYENDYKDPAGGTVGSLRIKKGTEVVWSYDDGYGWSAVMYKGKPYYMMNINLRKSGLSKCQKSKLSRNVKAYKLESGRLGKIVLLKKGWKITVICTIFGGKYEGCSLVKRKGKYYYARLNA